MPVNPVQHSSASIIIILLRNFEKRGELGGRPRRTSSCPGDGLWHLRCCTVRSKHFSQTSFSSSSFSSSHPFPPASPFLPRPLHLAGALLSTRGSVSGISFSPSIPSCLSPWTPAASAPSQLSAPAHTIADLPAIHAVGALALSLEWLRKIDLTPSLARSDRM